MSVLSILFLLLGIFFFFGATIGFLRFPDFYSRMHATGKSDTLGTLLCLIGLALYNGFSLVSIKIVLIAVFIFVASPTATHAILRAAFDSDVTPWTKDGRVIREGGEDKSE
ncbi:MAG TPA: monovalent cation/H(+) antiporter subunit G [Thermodesulfobacteriota bacterium]|nr:monovalent cation/H(+) antiporter subunit G [Thermodesulfobacteriota bacterium]